MDKSLTAHPVDPPVDPANSATDTPVPERGIASAALIVMLFFLLSRITGLVREVVVAAHFGAGAELDAYLAAFRVPDLLFQLVAGGALGSAFIPIFSTYWTKDDTASAWLLFSRVINLITLLLVIVAGVALLFAQPLVRLVIAPGFEPAQQVVTAQLMRWMLLGTIVFGVSGLVMGALNARQHFLLPAAAPVLYNLAIILAAWLLSPALGVYGLAVGVVAGAFVHFAVQAPGLWRVGARYTPSLTWRDPGVQAVARLMGPRVLGLFFVQMHFLVNTILASTLAPGSLSALNYAWLLMLLPQGLFAQSLATAAFPTLAAQAAAGQLTALRQTLYQTLRLVLFLALPSAVGLAVLGTPVIQLLLQRGQFTAEDTQQVAHALRWYALGLAGHAILEIVVRAFYALHDTRTPVTVGIAAMIVNILLSLWWVGWLAHGGLALANSVATSVEVLVLLWLLRRRLQGIEGEALLLPLLRHLGAAGIMGLALIGWLRWSAATLHLTGTGLAVMQVTGGIVLGGVLFVLLAWVFGSRELRPLWAQIVRRLPVASQR
jgi:putative peptidoglycan lipid II flippase